jgi:hypothetical protein
MKILPIASALLLTALVSGVRAQLVPPPPTATLVNFDDIDLGPNQQIPFLVVTDQYVNRGVQFAGFGQNSGGLFNPSFDPSEVPYISLPNNIYFLSAFPVITGGLAQTPEFLTFYPPISHFQFDTGTFGQDCQGASIVTAQGFDSGGNLLGSTTLTATTSGETIAVDFPPPGAHQVIVTSSHSCGPPGSLFFGVEVFSMDNVAFVAEPQAASKCGQSLIDAAGKKAKAEASCYGKALQKGVTVDAACLQKASDGLGKTFAKGGTDCLVTPDADATNASVDAVIAQAIQIVTNGSPGPDVCFGKKLTAIGKKLQGVAKCFSGGAKKGVAADPACVTKAGGSFNSSLKSCGTPTQLAPVEQLIDQFSVDLNRQQTVPTTTTSTTTTSTTTTTSPPPLGKHLSFTTTPGTASCALPDPAPPVSGEIDSDLVGSKITDLGLGCLYIGGGAATVSPSQIPENATTVLDSPDGTTLQGSLGTSRADCSVGPQGATKHCANNPTVECSSDNDCFAPGGCLLDPTCYFGPPIPVNGFPSSCVVNTFKQNASGTLNQATGESTVDIELASLVYLTLGQPTACPICDGGACNYGANAGGACTTTNTNQTSLDCLPNAGIFVATLGVSLNPLTSSTVTTTAADGLFCPSQPNAGGFGQTAAEAITQNGSPAGDLTDGAAHAGVLVSNFCIPATGSLALDGLANLPGPGSISLPGNAQFFSPSGAFIAE